MQAQTESDCMQRQMESPYYGYTRAAAYCNVNRVTLWRATRSNSLTPSGPGRAVRFHRDELDRWMASRSR